MAKGFERRRVGNGSRLIQSTCTACQQPIAASKSKQALKIAEQAHLRNSTKCGDPQETSEPADERQRSS
jgi:hypothetical protein